MGRKRVPQPSEAELAILRVLWQQGPGTVRQVHQRLGRDEQTRYTTTLKQMQLMAEKGMLARDQSQRSHVYRAAIPETATKQSLVQSFVDRVFDGSTRKMVLHALAAREIDAAELAEIQQLIGQLERQQKSSKS